LSGIRQALEEQMDTSTSRRLLEEIGPRVTGARVVGVRFPGQDCLLLELAGARSLHLGAVTMKAMPIVFLLEGEGPESILAGQGGPAENGPTARPRAAAEPPPFTDRLRGGEIVSVSPLPDRPGASVRLRWTSAAGRDIERALVIDLGHRPAMSLRDSGHLADYAVAGSGSPAARGERPDHGAGATDARVAVSPTVTSWRDDHGRLHARLSLATRADDRGESHRFESLNEGAVYMFAKLWPGLALEGRRERLGRVIERRLKRTRRAMDKVEREIVDSGNADVYRHIGQLLMTRQKEVRRGLATVTLKDYDGETDVAIELDPTVGPQQNAERYFRRARKAERRRARAPVRLGELEEKARDLEAAANSLDSASVRDLERLERRFFSKTTRQDGRKKPTERARFRTYHVSGGWEVLVGKSNRDNDVLSHQIARPDDLWFHARQVPGSHVVLRKSGRKAEPDRQAIMETAAIAAFHSKAGKSSKVSVCYTEKRHVRKARGGKPGEAVVAREKVVLVEPRLPAS
jgi:hypothetical protein